MSKVERCLKGFIDFIVTPKLRFFDCVPEKQVLTYYELELLKSDIEDLLTKINIQLTMLKIEAKK